MISLPDHERVLLKDVVDGRVHASSSPQPDPDPVENLETFLEHWVLVEEGLALDRRDFLEVLHGTSERNQLSLVEPLEQRMVIRSVSQAKESIVRILVVRDATHVLSKERGLPREAPRVRVLGVGGLDFCDDDAGSDVENRHDER